MNNLALTPKKSLRPPVFWLVSVVAGVVAGLGAAVFRGLIAWFHNLLFLGKFSFHYNANLHTPASPWRMGIILAPVIGALGVAYLVKTFAREAKGRGVSEIMEAVYYHKGAVRPIVAVIKALASALSIGSGGSEGREGPIVQIGSSFGSTMGYLLRVPSWQRITLVAAGAGGGIAATFNTPIGGILFAAELLLPEISARTLIPVVIATATATYIGRLLLGVHPSFVIPGLETAETHPSSPFVLLACVGLGCLLGVVSTVFIKSIYGFEVFFERKISLNYYLRHALGMLLVGIIICLMQWGFGHYYVEGVGYATIQDILKGTLTALPLLLLLFILKVVTTSLTLGSGGSGGIFSPALFLGATFGSVYGVLLKLVFPHLPASLPTFAVVGMAGVVGSATGAAITAIVMIFEMTSDYSIILPIIITVAISYGVRRFLSKDSLYTMKLTRRGLPTPESLQANSWLVRLASDYMDQQLAIVSTTTPRNVIAEILAGSEPAHWFLVEEEGLLIGVLPDTTLTDLIRQNGDLNLRQTAIRDYEVVPECTTIFEMISRTRIRQPEIFLVTSQPDQVLAKDIKGIISKQYLTQTMIQAIASAPE